MVPSANDSTGAFSRDLTSTSFPPDQTPGPTQGVTNFSPSQLVADVGNTAPTANAGGPYSINEGGSLTLSPRLAENLYDTGKYDAKLAKRFALEEF